MKDYLADGTQYRAGLMVTKTDDCPDSKWAYSLIRGVTVTPEDEIEDEAGGACCRVEGIEIDQHNSTWRPGRTEACLLKYLKLYDAGIDFNHDEFLSLIRGDSDGT